MSIKEFHSALEITANNSAMEAVQQLHASEDAVNVFQDDSQLDAWAPWT